MGVRREIALNDIERSGVLDAQEAVFVARLQANEDAAYDELVRGYHAQIFHVALTTCGWSYRFCFVLRGALGLDMRCAEHTVFSQPAIRYSLRAIAESVR